MGPAGADVAESLGPSGTTVQQLWNVSTARRPVTLTPEATDRIVSAHQSLHAAAGPVYGFTTGVGALDVANVARTDNASHQRSLLRSHAAGVGDPMDGQSVHAMMFARLAVLARGVSGVSPAFVEGVIGVLNAGVVPRVPRHGSVGAADLSPLAHAGLAVVGEGEARRWSESSFRPAAEVLAEVRLKPVKPTGRDALGWMGGPAQTVAMAALLLPRLERWIDATTCAAALSAVGLRSRVDAWSADLDHCKPHPGSCRVAQDLRKLVGQGGAASALREPLSTRGTHHVLGALVEATDRLRCICEIELRAAVDNPTLTSTGRWVNNAASFDGSHLAQALDAVVASLTHAAAASERRTSRLLDSAHNRGLPPFLIHPQARPGVSSGLMLAQYTAASLVARLRRRSIPAGIGSIPTCAGTEDHVSMAAESADNATQALREATQIAAAELLCAAQAVDLRDDPLAPSVRRIHSCLRQAVEPWIDDRVLAHDLERLAVLIKTGGAIRGTPIKLADGGYRG